jgi:hypothetical protein
MSSSSIRLYQSFGEISSFGTLPDRAPAARQNIAAEVPISHIRLGSIRFKMGTNLSSHPARSLGFSGPCLAATRYCTSAIKSSCSISVFLPIDRCSERLVNAIKAFFDRRNPQNQACDRVGKQFKARRIPIGLFLRPALLVRRFDGIRDFVRRCLTA